MFKNVLPVTKLVDQLDTHSHFPVVAIGTSAGGIRALQTFFESIPADTGAAFVVVLHLDPEHRSDLSSIIAARTSMTVTQVQSRIRIEPNHIYVIPPNRQLVVSDGSLDTCDFDEPRGKRAPIDLFFRSLATKLDDGFAVILDRRRVGWRGWSEGDQGSWRTDTRSGPERCRISFHAAERHRNRIARMTSCRFATSQSGLPPSSRASSNPLKQCFAIPKRTSFEPCFPL